MIRIDVNTKKDGMRVAYELLRAGGEHPVIVVNSDGTLAMVVVLTADLDSEESENLRRVLAKNPFVLHFQIDHQPGGEILISSSSGESFSMMAMAEDDSPEKCRAAAEQAFSQACFLKNLAPSEWAWKWVSDAH